MSPIPPAWIITPFNDVPTDKETEKEYDIIGELPLHENVGGGKSANTSVSVLQGVLRIERADDANENYRIIAAFHLQVKIHGFEKGYFKTVDRLFDFISLRYLYDKDEIHEVLPDGSPLTTNVEVTEESTKTRSAQLGISATAPAPAVTPSLSVQVGRDTKLTVKRNVDTWSRGLSYEAWHQKRPSHFEHDGEYHGEPTTQRHSRHHHVFQIQSQHAKHCICTNPFQPECCPYRHSDLYTRCVHWFWQVQAQPLLWVPEIYESVTFLITITRIVDSNKIDASDVQTQDMQRYLHFDFVLKTRLRELGWTLRDRLYPWRPRKPAEVRAKTDFGYPLGVEKVKFCIRACPEGISWPGRSTKNLQREAIEVIAGHKAVPFNLKSVDEKKRKIERDRERLRHQAEQTITSETGKLRREMEDKFKEMERRNATENLKREIEAVKNVLASRPSARQGGRRSPLGSSSEGDSYEDDPRSWRSPDRYRRPRTYERRPYEYDQGTASPRREYPDDSRWQEETTQYEIPRGRSRRRTHYSMPETPIVIDTHRPRGYRYEPVEGTIMRDRSRTPAPYRRSGGLSVPFMEEEDGYAISRSISRSHVRRRSYSRTRSVSARLGRPRPRSLDPQLDTDGRYRRRSHDEDGREARMIEKIQELERRVRAEELKAVEERERARMEAERDKLLRARREDEEQRKSKPPTRRFFKPGRGVKEKPSGEQIQLVDHIDLCEGKYEWVRKREIHQDHHHHRGRITPSLLMYTAGARHA